MAHYGAGFDQNGANSVQNGADSCPNGADLAQNGVDSGFPNFVARASNSRGAIVTQNGVDISQNVSNLAQNGAESISEPGMGCRTHPVFAYLHVHVFAFCSVLFWFCCLQLLTA